MYQLTKNPDMILCLETGTFIPHGHWMWVGYEEYLAAGNVPLPVTPVMTLSEAIAAKREEATAARWKHETGGIELGGVRVGTGLDDQNRISGVLSAIAVGGLDSVDFKAASGWLRLTAADLQGIAQAISAHVQACFSAERAHHEAIDQLTSPAQVAAYDLTQGWPG